MSNRIRRFWEDAGKAEGTLAEVAVPGGKAVPRDDENGPDRSGCVEREQGSAGASPSQGAPSQSAPSQGATRRRGPREPSPRNKAVYYAVRAQGFTQEEVAQEFGISQTRVSQIVRKADRWFATPQSASRDIPTSEGRKRLAGHLDLARLDTIYALAMRDHQRAQQRQCTSKSGTNDGRYYSETVHRDVVTSQPLRTALRALELMWRLDERNAKGGRKTINQQPDNSPKGEALALSDEPLTGAGK